MREPRYLVVRFSAIGDCVMAAHAATAIRRARPDAFLCWAVEGRCAPVVDRYDLVTQRYEIPRDRWKQARWRWSTWRDQLVKYTRLRELKFDYGFDLQGHSKTALLLRLAAPRQRIAAGATDALAARLNPVMTGREDGEHHVDWQHRVVNRWESFPLCEHPMLPGSEGGRRPDRVTICTGASHAERLIEPARWDAVARALMAQGYEVLFVGGPRDAHPGTPGAEDLIGKTRLKETIQLIRDSALHLSGDTGTGHIAAAVGTPVVTVFGPQDPRVFRPYTRLGRVLQRDGNPNAIEPAEIVDAARELLGAADREPT